MTCVAAAACERVLRLPVVADSDGGVELPVDPQAEGDGGGGSGWRAGASGLQCELPVRDRQCQWSL